MKRLAHAMLDDVQLSAQRASRSPASRHRTRGRRALDRRPRANARITLRGAIHIPMPSADRFNSHAAQYLPHPAPISHAPISGLAGERGVGSRSRRDGGRGASTAATRAFVFGNAIGIGPSANSFTQAIGVAGEREPVLGEVLLARLGDRHRIGVHGCGFDARPALRLRRRCGVGLRGVGFRVRLRRVHFGSRRASGVAQPRAGRHDTPRCASSRLRDRARLLLVAQEVVDRDRDDRLLLVGEPRAVLGLEIVEAPTPMIFAVIGFTSCISTTPPSCCDDHLQRPSCAASRRSWPASRACRPTTAPRSGRASSAAAPAVVERAERRAKQADRARRFLRRASGSSDRSRSHHLRRRGLRRFGCETEWLATMKPPASIAREQLARLLAVLAEQAPRHDEERRRDVVLLERVDHRGRGVGVGPSSNVNATTPFISLPSIRSALPSSGSLVTRESSVTDFLAESVFSARADAVQPPEPCYPGRTNEHGQ